MFELYGIPKVFPASLLVWFKYFYGIQLRRARAQFLCWTFPSQVDVHKHNIYGVILDDPTMFCG